MITLAVLLLLAAAILLIVEAFIPDFGICGILGIASFIGSIIITIVHAPYGIYIVICELVAFGIFAYLLFKFIFQRRFQGKVVLNDTLEFSEPEINPIELLGKEGVASTPLKPIGFVDFNGTKIEVSSEGAYIHERSRVKVVNRINNRLIVRLLKEEHSN